MNIGFDLDKIFIDYPPFIPDVIIDKLYKQESNRKLVYRIPSKPEQILRLIIHQPIFRQPIKENISFVKKLALQNANKHYLISGRFCFLRNKTNAIVKRYSFDKIFDAMFFNFKDQQPHIFKDEVIRRTKIDRYVDDDLPLLEFIAKNHQNTKFFWLNKYQSRQLSKNLFAIKDLIDMFNKNVHLRGVAPQHLGGVRRTPPR